MTLEDLRKSVRYSVFGDSTESSYADADLDRNLNLWYKTAVGWALSVNGDWQVNGEIATKSLVEGQTEYLLPTDILRLNQVYIKVESGGEYFKAKQIDTQEVKTYSLSDSYYPHPPEFDLLENSMRVYTSNETIPAISNGLKIYYQTKVTELTETTDEASLTEPFEKILIAGASYEYCIANEMGKSEQFKRDINEARRDLENYYANRSEVKPVRIIPNEENYY